MIAEFTTHTDQKVEDASIAPKVPPVIAEALSPHSELMGQVGKSLLLDALETGRQFCKSMVALANGAIPVYYALLNLVRPETTAFSLGQAVTVSIPPMLFLGSAIAFAHGYFPLVHEFSIDLPNQVNDVHSRTVYHRRRFARIGFALFCLGLMSSGVVIPLAVSQVL